MIETKKVNFFHPQQLFVLCHSEMQFFLTYWILWITINKKSLDYDYTCMYMYMIQCTRFNMQVILWILLNISS